MKYLRKGVWYLATRLLIIAMVLGLVTVTFYYAMNATNIYIVLKDGMARRAQVVMMEEDIGELNKYFLPAFIEQDPVIQAVKNDTSPYKNYTVRGIDHRLKMSFLWVWPWDDTVRVKIEEKIPRIDGRAKGSKADELVAAGGSSALYPPQWQNGKYKAVLVKDKGQWKIRSLNLYEYAQ